MLDVIATEGLAVRKSGLEKSSLRSENLILITREKWHFEEESRKIEITRTQLI